MKHLTYFARLDGLYKFHLQEINNIKFTQREIDVISCIRHNKGERKIASILSIAHRTVGTHLHNIMTKLEVSGRDFIITFIEKSGASQLLDEYYFNLTILMQFEEKLRLIGEVSKIHAVNIVIDDISELSKAICFKSFKKHLQFAKIIICNKDHDLQLAPLNVQCILKNDDLKKHELESIFLKINNDIEYDSINIKKIVDFSNKTEYYTEIFSLIRILHNNNKQINKIAKTFKADIQQIQNNFYGVKNIVKQPFYSTNKFFCGICLVLLLICSAVVIKTTQYARLNGQIRYDIMLPHESFLLTRSKILNQIESVLHKNDIAVVALVGIGGAGKTTLARHYAKQHTGDVVWEINAETEKTLLASFEQLAYAISKDSEDKQQLRNIQQITDIAEKRKKLQIFITTHIKQYRNWFLIYDNVNNFSSIIDFFPHDKEVWGNGEVIITTRDSNIAHNNFITEKNVIMMLELQHSEKINLFKKIVGKSNIGILTDHNNFDQFIKQMPPFPLDIVAAASYIKNTGTSFNKYIENISRPTNYFEKAQMGFLMSVGHYNSTRYGIITLSMKQLIDGNDDFRDLVLFISLLKNTNIPRSLLVDYKGEIVVHNFLRKIRMYSFLLIDKDKIETAFNSFDLHKTVQHISYFFLKTSIEKEEYNKILKSQTEVITNYLYKKSNNNIGFSEIKLLESHAEKFLSICNANLPPQDTAKLEIELANYYIKTTKFYKAKRLLEKCVNIVESQYGKNSSERARILHLFGLIYYNLFDYHKAITVFKKVVHIKKTIFGTGSLKFNESLLHLAMISSDIGQHFKATELLEPAITVIQNHYGENHVKTADALMHLAKALYAVGNYARSEKLLRKALSLYTDSFSSEHLITAEVYHIMSSIYRQKGYYKESIDMLNKALKIRRREYGDDNVLVAELKVKLAHAYRHIGEYNTALPLLKSAISVYKNKYGINNMNTAWAMTYLGHLFWDSGKINDSIQLLTQASEIMTKNYGEENLYTAWSFLRLGYILTATGSYDKAREFIQKGYKIYGKYYKYPHIEKAWSDAYIGSFYNKTNKLTLALSHLKKALEIYQKQFGKNHKRTNWIKIMLADNYSRRGDFAKALKLSEEAYESYRLHYGEQHSKTALSLQAVGRIYFAHGLSKGEKLVRESLKILESQNSSKLYSTFSIMADIAFKKAQTHKRNGKMIKAQHYYRKSQEYLDQSLKIAKRNLLSDSEHIKFLEQKSAKLASMNFLDN